jgi:hypothetical protein
VKSEIGILICEVLCASEAKKGGGLDVLLLRISYGCVGFGSAGFCSSGFGALPVMFSS